MEITYNIVNGRYPLVGTKNVAKEMKKISEGRVRDRGVTWFPELVDKRKDICCIMFLSLVSACIYH